MFKHKLIASILLAILVVAMQTGIVAAAPASQTPTPITGTIQTITVVTAVTPNLVKVEVLDSLGVTKTAYVSINDAVLLGLVTLDPVTQLPVVDMTKIGQTITIEAAQQLPTPLITATGTIQIITVITGTGTTPTIIQVEVLDSLGKTQKVYVSLDTAVLLGLVTLDPVTQLPLVDMTKIGQTITIEAAQQVQPPTTEIGLTGTIQSITIIKGTTETLVLVRILDDQGVIQKAYISVDTAVLLGLVTLDPVTNLPVVDTTMIGEMITIDTADLLIPPTDITESQHPVANLLADHFDVEGALIMDLHTQGFGFGEIAQALFMAEKLGDPYLASEILGAKKSGDYSAFALDDGSTPKNWGQLRHAVLGHGKNNLGVVVSGHGDSSTESTESATSAPGNSGNAGSNGNGHNPDKGNGNDKGNNGHGNNKP